MAEQIADPFAHFDTQSLEYPWDPDDKSEDELMEEFHKGTPPMRRGRRIPYAVFLRVINNSRPDEENAVYDPVTKQRHVQYLRYRKHALSIFDLSGSNGQESVILEHMKKCKKLLRYWLPNTTEAQFFGGGQGFDTSTRNLPVRSRGQLAQLLETLRHVNADNVKELHALNLDKDAEIKALNDKIKQLGGNTNGSNKDKQKQTKTDNRRKARQGGLPEGDGGFPSAA